VMVLLYLFNSIFVYWLLVSSFWLLVSGFSSCE
jgi:hypothetical protein